MLESEPAVITSTTLPPTRPSLDMITIKFEINGYKDALFLADDHTLTNAEIETMKRQRYEKWYAIISDPNPPQIEETEG